MILIAAVIFGTVLGVAGLIAARLERRAKRHQQ